jgi:hypothetical protein
MSNKRNPIKINKTIIFLMLSIFSINAIGQRKTVKAQPTHFLNNSFSMGIIKKKSGLKISANMDYNKITQEMIFEKNGKRIAIADLTEIDTIYLLDKKFIPNEKVFFEVAVDEAIALFIQYKSNLILEGKDIGYGKSQTTGAVSYTEILGKENIYKLELPDDYYVADITIFWVKKGDVLENISSKRRFLKLFADKKAELEEYIKSNDLKTKNINDMVMLVKYCNELYN